MGRLYGSKGWYGPAPQQTIKAHEPPPMPDVWLTLDQASSLTGLSASRLRTLAREGLVRARKDRGPYGGVRWMVERSALYAFRRGS